MAIIPPFLCAVVFGAALYVLVLRRLPVRSPLEMVVAFWFGLGFCSLLTFSSLIASGGHFNPGHVLSLSIFFFICAIAYLWHEISSQLHFNVYRMGLKDVFFCALVLLVWLTQTMIATRNPYGDWDAWAFWNYIPHYFFTGGHRIQDLYSIASEARHPWLLPAWHLFGGALAWQETLSFPIISAQVFSVALLALVYYAILEETSSVLLAVLGGASLFSLCGYIFHSMSQYADVLMAGLFLSNMLWMMRLSRDGQVTWREGMCAGLMLGLMAFLKDEGILCAGIIICVTAWMTRMNIKAWAGIAAAFLLLLSASIVVKSWMLNLPAEPRHLYWPYLFELSRWGMVFAYGGEILLNFLGAGALLYPLMVLVCILLGTLRRHEGLALVVVMVYIGVFVVFLVMRENLRWYIDGAAYRFVYQMLPLLVVVVFNNLGRLRWMDNNKRA